MNSPAPESRRWHRHQQSIHLPVVRHGELLGLVSIGDVVKARLEEAQHESEALRAYIVAG